MDRTAAENLDSEASCHPDFSIEGAGLLCDRKPRCLKWRR